LGGPKQKPIEKSPKCKNEKLIEKNKFLSNIVIVGGFFLQKKTVSVLK
jgi:actin-related protein